MNLLQKMRLGLKGWLRRRSERAEGRRAAFLDRELRWERPAEAERPPEAGARPGPDLDWEGLQVAWLDRSGRIAWYFDPATGEVLRAEEGSEPPGDGTFHLIPHRSAETDRADREAFTAGVEDARMKSELETANRAEEPDAAFRAALVGARELERSWISFRNARASRAVAEWVRGLRKG